ncbi:MAG TPA: SHOCT domain-containing protein [Methanomassiliicoccales archaeon]|nr:SHOCT domain-containing protein [Methanomassiliicoccales archaeon]
MLTEMEERELAIGLLKEWWITATQALVDELGTHEALRLMYPGFKNHGRAGYHIAAKLMSLPEGDFRSIAVAECWAKFAMAGVPIHGTVKGGKASWSAKGCETLGTCKEACQCFCQIAGEGLSFECHPDARYSLVRSLSFGDDVCEAEVVLEGDHADVDSSVTEVSSGELGMSPEDLAFWRKAVLGENWAIVTRATIEGVGGQRTVEILRPYMKQSGLSLGIRMKQMTSVQGNEADAIPALIESIRKSFGIVEPHDTADMTENDGTDCPFSGAPTEICCQIEAFLNGVCEAIDPSSEFAYDSMVTKGGKTCRWTIKKKRSLVPSKEPPLEDDDALKALRLRFAKGEITLEQYRQHRDILLEK